MNDTTPETPTVKTNRQAHEEAAGMGLEDSFFAMNGIDPEAPYAATPPAGQDGSHSPLPWRQATRGPNGCPIIGGANNVMVCMLAHSANEPEQAAEAEANAAIIVAAVNGYNALAAQLAQAQQNHLKLANEYHHQSQQLAQAQGEARRLQVEVGQLKAQVDVLPANWMEDSSLETWFPMTARELSAARAECERLREEDSELKERIDWMTPELDRLRAENAELAIQLGDLAGYASTVRVNRYDATGEFSLQTVDWCEGLVDLARAALAKHQQS